MRPRRLRFLPLSVSALALSAGCEEPRHDAGAKPAPAPQPALKAEDNFIVGKRTQDVRNAEPELQKGAQVGTTKITASGNVQLSY